MNITYFGHSAFLLQGNQHSILIDPFISDNPFTSFKAEDLSGITHILVTHGHGDHLGDAAMIAKNCSATVVCNYEIAGYLAEQGANIHPMHIGGRTKLEFGTIKMTPALHGSGIETDDGFIYGGNPGGFLFELDGKKIYHAGDTGLTMDMKLLEGEQIDLAFLPIGGNFTMDIEDALIAIDFIRPRLVVPMHYKTFEVIEADPEEFKTRSTNCEVKIIDFDQSIQL